MPVAVHPVCPDVSPQVTRFVQLAGVSFTIRVTREGDRWLAWHEATGCWGYAGTITGAMEDITLMLANERDWYCTGEGARLYLHGRMHERRAAVQKAFGGQ